MQGIFALCILIGAIAVRYYIGTSELWLDEIWGFLAAHKLPSAWALYTAPALDGHSSLYTAFLWFISTTAAPEQIRSLALISGALSLLVLWYYSGRRVMMLAAISYPLLLYSTEARGYAPMLFFMLLARYWVERRGSILLSAGSAILSFLFHYSVLPILLVLVFRAYQKSGLRWAISFAVPVFFVIGGVYQFVLRTLGEGSGALFAKEDFVISSLSFIAGGVPTSAASLPMTILSLLTALFMIFILLRAFSIIYRARNFQDLSFYLLIFFVPVLFLILKDPKVLHPRYLVYLVPFFIELFALQASYKNEKIIGQLTIVLFIGFNLGTIFLLLQNRKAHYKESFATAMLSSSDGKLVVQCDNRFRHILVASYYKIQLTCNEIAPVKISTTHDLGALTAEVDTTFQEKIFFPAAPYVGYGIGVYQKK